LIEILQNTGEEPPEEWEKLIVKEIAKKMEKFPKCSLSKYR